MLSIFFLILTLQPLNIQSLLLEKIVLKCLIVNNFFFKLLFELSLKQPKNNLQLNEKVWSHPFNSHVAQIGDQ